MTLRALLIIVIAAVSVPTTLAQTVFLRAEYIRLGDRLLAVERPVEWSDNFNRVGLGSNWLLDRPINYPFSVQVAIESDQMKWFGWSLTAVQTPGAAIPVPVLALDGQPQWAEVKFTDYDPATTAGTPDTRIGPAVLYQGSLAPPNSTARGYFLQLSLSSQSQDWHLSLMRLDQPNNAATVLLGNVGTLVAGQVIRIEVIPGSAAHTLKGYRNGEWLFTHVDDTSQRVPLLGTPAIYCDKLNAWCCGFDPVDILYLDDFAAGLL